MTVSESWELVFKHVSEIIQPAKGMWLEYAIWTLHRIVFMRNTFAAYVLPGYVIVLSDGIQFHV